jgi:hypothetical protein
MVVDKVQVHLNQVYLNQVQVHLGHLLVSKEVAQVLEGELKFQLMPLLEPQVSVILVFELEGAGL